MKMKMLLISFVSAALVVVPSSVRADQDKLSETDRKTHEKMCDGQHGTVTAKDANSITIDGKRYALTIDARVTKQGEAILPKTLSVGDHVCYKTEKAADGTMQISQAITVPKDTEKVRVREKESDTPSKGQVETPNKKIEVK